MAKAAGVGMHVDSCLGGFIVNFVDGVDPNWLAVPGVTSLSCDTHKNGWAPKPVRRRVSYDDVKSQHKYILLWISVRA